MSENSGNEPLHGDNCNTQLCPLDNLDHPPVSEIEHLVSECYCHLCTCLLHKCPGDYPKHHKSPTWQSLYRKDFKKHSYQATHHKPKCNEYSPSQHPFAGTTTHREDFRAFDLPMISRPPKSSSVKFHSGFPKMSRYQADFPNWGPHYTERVTKVPEVYRGSEIKMNCQTVYRADFTRSSLSPANRGTMKKPGKSSGVISYAQTWLAEKKVSQLGKTQPPPKRERGPSNEYLPPVSWKNHFASTYREDFKGQRVHRLPKKKYAKVVK